MSRFIAILLILASCKTTSRGEFSDSMSTILIKIPDSFKDYESRLSLSRIDSKADPKVVRGNEIQLKLPKGEYNLDLTLTNKAGQEEYQLCDNSRRLKFVADKEEPILDLCNRINKQFVAKTLATSIIISNPPIDKGTEPSTPIEKNPIILPKPDEPTGPIVNEPVFKQEASCFGLDTAYSQEGNEIVIKTAKSIADYVIDNGNYPRCKLTLKIGKEIGKTYQPVSYSVKFSGNEATLAQNLFLTVTGKDENGLLSLPCKTMVLSTTANSGNLIGCSFYDFDDKGEIEITDRNRLAYDKSCKSASKELTFEFIVVGKNGASIEELKIPEIRIDLTKVEACQPNLQNP